MKFFYFNKYLEVLSKKLKTNLYDCDKFYLHMKEVNPIMIGLNSVESDLNIYAYDVLMELDKVTQVEFNNKVFHSFCMKFGSHFGTGFQIENEKIQLLGLSPLFTYSPNQDEEQSWNKVFERSFIRSYPYPLKYEDLNELLVEQLSCGLECLKAINKIISNREYEQSMKSKLAILKLAITDILKWQEIINSKNGVKEIGDRTDIKVITLKSLFINPDETYDNVISKLEKNGILNSRLEVIIPDKYQKRGDKAFLCSIIMQLDNHGYLKICDDTDKVKALNHTFKVNVTKQNYNSLYNSKNQNTYLKYTSFLVID